MQTNFTPQDQHFMSLALSLASQGARLGEVPVGAVLVQFDDDGAGNIGAGNIIAEGFNQPIATSDPTAHAEIVALRRACKQVNNYRLPTNSTLYVTLEPCTMCVGALIHARLNRLVFATTEPRAGMVGSQANLLAQDFYNHRIIVESGLCADESSKMLTDFFRQKRAGKKQSD